MYANIKERINRQTSIQFPNNDVEKKIKIKKEHLIYFVLI